jgi:hypothetical protein
MKLFSVSLSFEYFDKWITTEVNQRYSVFVVKLPFDPLFNTIRTEGVFTLRYLNSILKNTTTYRTNKFIINYINKSLQFYSHNCINLKDRSQLYVNNKKEN